MIFYLAQVNTIANSHETLRSKMFSFFKEWTCIAIGTGVIPMSMEKNEEKSRDDDVNENLLKYWIKLAFEDSKAPMIILNEEQSLDYSKTDLDMKLFLRYILHELIWNSNDKSSNDFLTLFCDQDKMNYNSMEDLQKGAFSDGSANVIRFFFGFGKVSPLRVE